MLPLKLVTLIRGAHAVGDADKAAAVIKDNGMRQLQKALPPAWSGISNRIIHGRNGHAPDRSVACNMSILVGHHYGDSRLWVANIQCAASCDEFNQFGALVVVPNCAYMERSVPWQVGADAKWNVARVHVTSQANCPLAVCDLATEAKSRLRRRPE